MARQDGQGSHHAKGVVKAASQDENGAPGQARLPGKVYERELFRLQGELVTMQEWVRA
jgi:hypothetical protein